MQLQMLRQSSCPLHRSSESTPGGNCLVVSCTSHLQRAMTHRNVAERVVAQHFRFRISTEPIKSCSEFLR